MDSLDQDGMVTFEVQSEREGGYSAYARVGTWSLVTQGDDMNELLYMVNDLVQIYNDKEDRKISSYSLKFDAASTVAA